MRTRPRPRLAIVLLAGVTGCLDASPSGDEGGDVAETSASSDDGADTEVVDDGSGEPEAPDACADVCLDLESQEGVVTCHSCRCKVAFDDWLPPRDALQCGNGEPIVTYNAELLETGYELQPAAVWTTDCANPSLLTGSCLPGSRLGHLTHGDVSVYWICRDPVLDLDGSILFHDVAIIGHNARTGATCFWDDTNDAIHEDDAPPLDLQEASAQELARAVELFPYSDGSNCIRCHDHDPFIYTPYLQSTGWQSMAADKGPYHLVGLDGEPRTTGNTHLVSARAAPCTRCHRLGSDETCSVFAPDALGTHKIDAYEPEVHEAAEPGSPSWELAYWMPGEAHALADLDAWEDAFADARDHIMECCEAPGVDGDGCEWAPVPAE